MTAADRPTVTDNARDEEPLAWCPGCGDRIPTEVIRERGVCSNCYGTTDDPWAAGRAETTTATTEDAAARLAAAEAELDRLCSGGRFIMSVPPREGYDSDLLIQAALTDLRGLLATARTRTETTTATTEDAARVLDDVIQHLRKIWSTGHDEAREVIDTAEELLAQALPHLATARAETTTGAIARGEALAAGDPNWMNVTRWPQDATTTDDPHDDGGTRPTREQIDRAVGEVLVNAANHPDPVAVLGRSIAPLRTKITDAVLELLRDGAR